MTRWNVFVELPAQKDIAEARSWLAQREPEAADKWFESLYETIGSLEVFPERCPLAPENKSLKIGIRQLFHGRRHNKYRILFILRENEVHVLHVRHGSRLALGETPE